MKLLKMLTLMVAVLLTGGVLQAQNKTISGVIKYRKGGIRPIYQGTEVKGYIALYFFDKADKANNTYVLSILDENLNPVGEKKITLPKAEGLVESEYDGKNIVLKFADLSKKQYIFRLYNEQAEEVKKVTMPVGKWQLTTLSYYRENYDNMMPDMFAVDGLGFINYAMQDYKKIGYSINLVNETGTVWTYSSDKNSSLIETAAFMQSSGDVLLSLVYKKEKMMGTDMDPWLLALDIKTGKKLFEVPCATSKNEISPVGAYMEGEKVVVFGQYYPKKANVIKDKSLGFSVMEYSLGGKVNKEKLMTWAESVGKYQELKDNKLKDGGYIYFHKTIKASNGHIVLVGEQFRKAANAAGIVAMAMGGRGGETSKLLIEDFMFLDFDGDYNLTAAKRIDKAPSNFSFPGIDYMGAMMVAWMAKAYGAFDYEYTSYNEDKSKFNVVFLDYDRAEDSKKKEMFCGSVAYKDGNFTVDKVPFARDKEATLINVQAAKNGYFLVTKYYKKAKEIKMDLVKFNN